VHLLKGDPKGGGQIGLAQAKPATALANAVANVGVEFWIEHRQTKRPQKSNLIPRSVCVRDTSLAGSLRVPDFLVVGAAGG
jgi:hypothetical protein